MNRYRITVLLMLLICSGIAVSCSIVEADNLSQAAERGDIAEVRRRIESGTPVDGRAMHAMTPLMNAARCGQLESCRWLIQHGADVNAHNASGSVLMWAIDSGNAQLVRLILSAGADRHWKNSLGETAEDFARTSGHPAMANMIRHSAKPGS